MAERQRISRLGAETFFTQAAIALIGFVIGVIISRVLGPEGRGRYFLPVTAVQIAATFGVLSLDGAQFRAWARREAELGDIVWSTGGLAFALGLVAAAATWIAYQFARNSLFGGVHPFEMALAVCAIPISVTLAMCLSVMQITGSLRRMNLSLILGAAAQAIGIIVLATTGNLTVAWVIVLFALSLGVPVGLMFVRIVKLIRPRVPRPGIATRAARVGVQILPSALFTFFNLRVDVLLVAYYLDLRSVGLYSLAVTAAELVWFATDSLAKAVQHRQVTESDVEAIDVTLRSVRMNLVVATVLAVLIALLSPPVVRYVYGTEFTPCLPALWWLLPATIAMGAWRSVSPLLLRSGPPSLQAGIAGAASVANAVANVILIPHLGIAGASIASAMSYFFGAVLAIIALSRYVDFAPSALVPGLDEFRQIVDLVRRAFRARTPRL